MYFEWTSAKTKKQKTIKPKLITQGKKKKKLFKKRKHRWLDDWDELVHVWVLVYQRDNAIVKCIIFWKYFSSPVCVESVIHLSDFVWEDSALCLLRNYVFNALFS